jgi:hypothetical protein
MADVRAINRQDLCWGIVQCQAIIVVYGLFDLVER